MITNPTKGFTFDAPAKNTDGSDITADEIAKYQLGLGTTSGNYATIIDDADLTPDADGKQFTPLTAFGTLAFGQYFAAVRAVTKDGQNSDWSAEVTFALVAPPVIPVKPENFSVA